ncbi:hypothetical protein TW83_10080 [Paracoccus sp. S4493]|nr:hypothetical protein TW83_10080 [Paracoccus sp. S4493]
MGDGARHDPPISDPREISEVLRSFLSRHHMTIYALAPRVGVTRATLGRWSATGDVQHEKMLRAILTLIDEGRA